MTTSGAGSRMRSHLTGSSLNRFLSAHTKRIGFTLSLLWVTCAWGQDWETPIRLEVDTVYRYGMHDLVVDSNLTIHAFLPRWGLSWQPNTLTYARFNNWGQVIAPPVELLPDSHYAEYKACAFIDSREIIHVVWNRWWDAPSYVQQLIHVRLSTDGSMIGDPLIIPLFNEFREIQQNINMVETPTGDFWVACGEHFFVVDSSGVLIRPLQSIYVHPVYGARLIFATGPDSSVWGCCRKSSGRDSVIVIRFFPEPRIEEIVIPDEGGPFPTQMGLGGFRIDQHGVFHYILFHEAIGLYYRRDARDGTPADSVVIDSNSDGIGDTFLSFVGTDSLQFLWGDYFPDFGIRRMVAHISSASSTSEQLLTPENFELNYGFYPSWRNGGYWISGGSGEGTPGPAMLHIAGPNEPPPGNAIGPTAWQRNATQINIYPQPSQGYIFWNIPARPRVQDVSLYNILGQRLMQIDVPTHQGSQRLDFPSSLPTGYYFLVIRTPETHQAARITLIH